MAHSSLPRRVSARVASAEVQRWLAEESDSGSDIEIFEDESESDEEDNIEIQTDFQNNDADVSQESDAEDTEAVTSENEPGVAAQYVAPDGTKWSSTPPGNARGRRSKANIVRSRRKVNLNGRCDKPIDALEVFLDDTFFETVLKFTNESLKLKRENSSNVSSYYQDFEPVEIRAAIGLLILCGILKSKGESLEQMWSDMYGRPVLKATMPLKRFQTFLAMARFDDKPSRKEREKSDKLAAIRELFDSFVAKSKSAYTPSPFVCVDETLIGFRGKCPFRVYMPCKPARYGIKIWSLCDNGTHYLCNCQVYTGKDAHADGPEKQQGARVVKDLVSYLYGSGGNVTMDNFFTSYTLGQQLLVNNMTLLGTVRKNRREVPKDLLSKHRDEHSSQFVFTADTSMVAYVPKAGRSVLLMSTMHSQPDVYEEDPSKKPFMILDYNETKGAVDAFDEQISAYTTARACRRWPMRIFYFLVDASCMNAYVCWTLIQPTWNDRPNCRRLDKRRLFLLDASHALIKPLQQSRADNPNVYHMPTVTKVMHAVGVAQMATNTLESGKQTKKRGRCASCPRSKEQKVKNRCSVCAEFVCGMHSSKTISFACNSCPYVPKNDN